MSRGSITCSPIERTGLSEVIGSWKIIEMSRPRISRISSAESAEQIAAVERDAALRHPAGLGEQAHDRERGDRLAAAGLADDGDDLAAIDRIGDAFDGANGAARGLEPHVQVAHLKQRRPRRRPAKSGRSALPPLEFGRFCASSCAPGREAIPDSRFGGQWETRRRRDNRASAGTAIRFSASRKRRCPDCAGDRNGEHEYLVSSARCCRPFRSAAAR